MKTIRKLALLALATVMVEGMSASAFALSISPGDEVLSGNETSQAQINLIVDPYIDPSLLLYKQDVGGAETGSLAGSYTTTFDNTPQDPSEATITYDGGQYVGPTAYLLVKDGNNQPAWYLFNLTDLGWDGTETLDLSGFWIGKGGISHVSLYGQKAPDGGTTVALLGLSMASLGFARWRFA